MRAYEARYGDRVSACQSQKDRSLIIYCVHCRLESYWWAFVEQTTGAITSGEIEAGSFNRNKFDLQKGSTVFILCESRRARNRLSEVLDRMRLCNARIYTADACRGVVPSNHPPCSTGATAT